MRGMGVFQVVSCVMALAIAGFAYAENTPSAPHGKSLTKDAVDVALKASAARSQKISDDALRVWRSFKTGDKPNYAYYYWARNIIFSLKKKQNVNFQSERDVKRAFEIMADEKLISIDAVPVLAKFVWENLERRKSMSPLEKIMPDYRREKEIIASGQSTQAKQES